MKRNLFFIPGVTAVLLFLTFNPSNAWFDETHLAIAKVAGYFKWFNAPGPDMIREKIGDREGHNHFVNNPRGTLVTPEMVSGQVAKYNKIDNHGHLYGALIASIRDYIKKAKTGKYAEYHLAFCSHYVGDLSQPLHNIEYNKFNRENHMNVDGIINDEVLGNQDKIKIYPITIDSEEAIIREVARIANLSLALGYKLEDEKRLLSKEEAYQQISHSASLFKAILGYVETVAKQDK